MGRAGIEHRWKTGGFIDPDPALTQHAAARVAQLH
jgi:hypothetical protein